MSVSYIVEARAHGNNSYVREVPAKLLSLKEAKADAKYFDQYADTIGGQARVVNAKTGVVIPHY